MTVTRMCDPGDIAVGLNVGAGEYLVYRIPTAPGDVQYVLEDDSGNTLFDNNTCPSPCERKWPNLPSDITTDRDVQHVLAMQFISEGTLEYKVTKHSGDGAEISVVKDCRFTNQGAPDSFFESLRVLIQP